jgi:uncharacterized protein (DUF2141 family)
MIIKANMTVKEIVSMILRKTVLPFFFTAFFAMNVFAGNCQIFIEITGVRINGGKINAKVFSTEKEYKKDLPFASFVLESRNTIITHTLDLPEGEYVIALFQDTNNNGKLDRNFFNIPKEPIGLTTYKGGIPGNFDKQKITVNKNTGKITLQLIEF